MTSARVYLTGFMGCGKSTVGPILANVLDYGFLDLDARIAAEAGRPVAALFADEGEAAFRAREADALRATGREPGLVVATGGGALVREPSLGWARRHGTVVYLKMSHEALVERLLRVREPRPLLLAPDGTRLGETELSARIGALLAVRAPFYEQAHVVVEADRLRLARTVDTLVRALHRLWRTAAPA